MLESLAQVAEDPLEEESGSQSRSKKRKSVYSSPPASGGTLVIVRRNYKDCVNASKNETALSAVARTHGRATSESQAKNVKQSRGSKPMPNVDLRQVIVPRRAAAEKAMARGFKETITGESVK